MDDIVTFLRARLDEDEAAARADIADEREYGCEGDHGWSPERVLAEVEAKRRIVEETERGCDGEGEYSRCAEWSDSILRLLALPHADHPDYDEAWKVE